MREVHRVRRFSVLRYLAPVTRHALLAAVAVAFLAPFSWMIISALKDNTQVFAWPIRWWPNSPRC